MEQMASLEDCSQPAHDKPQAAGRAHSGEAAPAAVAWAQRLQQKARRDSALANMQGGGGRTLQSSQPANASSLMFGNHDNKGHGV